MAVSAISALLLVLLVNPVVNLVGDANFTDALNRIEGMLDQLRTTDFTTASCTETLEYIAKYLSKWNLKDRIEYGQYLLTYGLLDIFSSWLDHFKKQSADDQSKLFMGKMLKVLLEGSRVDPYPGLTTNSEVLHKILSLTINDNLFNDRNFATDARLIAFDLSWNLYFAESRYNIQPFVMRTLSMFYGPKLHRLMQNRRETNEMLLLYEGKLLSLQTSSEAEATEWFSFDNSTLQSWMDNYLKMVEIPFTQPIQYRLMTNYSYEEWPLWYHDILLLFNNILLSPVNRKFLCNNLTYHHYLTAIHIFQMAKKFDQQRHLGRVCLRAIRGLTMLYETCDKWPDYFTEADFKALHSLENHRYMNIAKETKLLLQAMASSSKLCGNGTITYKVDFKGVYQSCNEAKHGSHDLEAEFVSIGSIYGTAAVVFAFLVAIFIVQIRAKCKQKRKMKNSSDEPREIKLSQVATSKPIGKCELKESTDTNCELNERAANDLPSPELYLLEEREIPEINYKRLTFVKNLGRGNFAIVDKQKLQYSRAGDALFVADKYVEEDHENFETCYEILLEEKMVMARMPQHTNLIKLLAFAVDNKAAVLKISHILGDEHLLLEYCHHRSLYDTIKKSVIRDTSLSDTIEQDGKGRILLTRYHLYFIAYQIIDGMNFLSSHKVVHRDLALRNVLLATGLLVKISDFGLAKLTANEYCAESGNHLPHEIAPEIRQKLRQNLKPIFTTKSDVYSLGILLWLLFEMSASESPKLLRSAALGHTVRRPKYANDCDCDYDDPDCVHTSQMYELIKSCLKTNPESRPDFKECLKQTVSACNSQSVTLIERIKENVLKYGNQCLQDENGIY